MVGVYFSGTGNTAHAVSQYVHSFVPNAEVVSIEDARAAQVIAAERDIVIGYPIYFSCMPRLMSEFLDVHAKLFQGKNVFVISTMGLWSGDGAGLAARKLKKHGARITGGLHLVMPDNICDINLIKSAPDVWSKKIAKADRKIECASHAMKSGGKCRDGMNPLGRLGGWLFQRAWNQRKVSQPYGGVKIDSVKCVGCGRCADCCPTQNIKMKDTIAYAGTDCALCYRCANACINEAITVMGKKVCLQYTFPENR